MPTELISQLQLNITWSGWGLLALIAADFIIQILGMRRACTQCSRKLRKEGFKKIGVLLMVALSGMLSKMFNDSNLIIYRITTYYYIYTELIAFLESVKGLGVSLPGMLDKLLANKKGEDKEEEK